MTDGISIVLPVDEHDDALNGTIGSYVGVLAALGRPWEIVVVPLAPDGSQGFGTLSEISDHVRIAGTAQGWGAGVRAGLAESRGDVLCYANWRRTSARALGEMLTLALRNPDVVLRANRRTRDTRIQRLGSLLFNVECRLLLQIPAWDVNGTPKVFPRAFDELLELRRDDDLFDAEFALVCERAAYPVIEVPIEAALLSRSSPHVGTAKALRMYLGVPRVRRDLDASMRHRGAK